MIAGHTFAEQPGGRRYTMCGKSWLAVLADREFWKPGQFGIAHHGALNEIEVGELVAEIERIWMTVRGDAAQ